MLFVGWDEPGGTYDHVPPGPVPPPDPSAPAGQLGFRFDRSGYRVPAVIVSPWIEEGSVYTEEYRHTSMIATLRKRWDLGEPFSGRDAAARTFDHVFVWTRPGSPTTGLKSPRCRCPPTNRRRWTPARHSARSVVTCATGCSSTPVTPVTFPRRRRPIPTCHRHSPSTSPSASAPGCSPASLGGLTDADVTAPREFPRRVGRPSGVISLRDPLVTKRRHIRHFITFRHTMRPQPISV